ncbi:GAF domain-containing protein [Thalassobacillus sp. CUG 92003]|uniref:GAF domain-containing protein n=1 Tax=Thalassobacillus sp. CUG 92003 TaxID=2736641 RepID=UPI0015E63236|nr:GAF domain-containing protein [Thalassobacillus sp. CUG 92003]
MFQTMQYTGTKEENYELLIKQLDALLEGENDAIANLSNAASLLNQFLSEVNWVGFYLWKNEQLVLGPFQGLPACVRIPYGKGVCGTALAENTTQRIYDVTQFEGHIACDAASQSEIVVPMYKDAEAYGVLDIDSPSIGRFDDVDQHYLESYAATLLNHL